MLLISSISLKLSDFADLIFTKDYFQIVADLFLLLSK